MLTIALISGVIMPPVIVWLLYSHITDQWRRVDGKMVMCQTKKEAQEDVRDALRRNPLTYVWMLYTCGALIVTCIAMNFFGFGDWYWSI